MREKNSWKYQAVIKYVSKSQTTRSNNTHNSQILIRRFWKCKSYSYVFKFFFICSLLTKMNASLYQSQKENMDISSLIVQTKIQCIAWHVQQQLVKTGTINVQPRFQVTLPAHITIYRSVENFDHLGNVEIKTGWTWHPASEQMVHTANYYIFQHSERSLRRTVTNLWIRYYTKQNMLKKILHRFPNRKTIVLQY